MRSVQAELDVPLALEPIAALFDWPDDEYTCLLYTSDAADEL